MATKTKKRQSRELHLRDAVAYRASCLKEAGDALHGLGPSQQYADAFNQYSEALKALLTSVCVLHVSEWSWDGYEGHFGFSWDFGTPLAQPGAKYEHDTRFMHLKCSSTFYPDRPLDEELARLAAESQHYADLRNAMVRWAADARKRSLAKTTADMELPRYGVMSVPGRREDGADTAWFVTDRRESRAEARHTGDGDAAQQRALAAARRLNVGGSR